MTTSMILPQPTVSQLSGSPLGPQLQMALGVSCASSPTQIAEALPVAEFFADRHGFYLPKPRDLKAPDASRRFVEETVPYFRNRMRPVFTNEVLSISRGEAPYDSFRGQELARIDICEIALGGLLTFDAAKELLESVERDIEGRLGSQPARRDAINPYFKGRSIAGRLAFMGAVVAGGLLLEENVWAKLGIAVGALLVVEALSYHFGARAKARQIVANRDSAVQIDKMRNTLQQVIVSSSRLEDVGYRVPKDSPHPGPVSVELRKAMIRERLNGSRSSFEIVDAPEVYDAFAGMLMKYLVVELPDDGGAEVRLISPNVLHPKARLDGEKIVGAGYLRMDTDEEGRRVLRFDGYSQAFPTKPEGVKSTHPSMLAARHGLKEVESILARTVAEDTAVEYRQSV